MCASVQCEAVFVLHAQERRDKDDRIPCLAIQHLPCNQTEFLNMNTSHNYNNIIVQSLQCMLCETCVKKYRNLLMCDIDILSDWCIVCIVLLFFIYYEIQDSF